MVSFVYDYAGNPFRIYSMPHWIALGIIALIDILMVRWVKNHRNNRSEQIVRYSLAALLILQEISLSIWRLSWNQWRPGTSLPLHLCGAAIVLGAVMLVNRNYRLYELIYFWGLGGAVQALLQPDIGPYGFPHYRFFQFFVSHGLIVTVSLYATVSFRYRPQLRSVWRVFIITNIYMAFIALFNWLTDGNYLFICHKPETASLMDFMGPWPWYIITLELMALISFMLYYSPFGLYDWWLRRRRIVQPEGVA